MEIAMTKTNKFYFMYIMWQRKEIILWQTLEVIVFLRVRFFGEEVWFLWSGDTEYVRS